MSNEIEKSTKPWTKSPARLVMFILMCAVTVGFFSLVVQLGANQFFDPAYSKAECYDWGCNIDGGGDDEDSGGWRIGGDDYFGGDDTGKDEKATGRGTGGGGGGDSAAEAERIRAELEEKQRRCDQENTRLQELIDAESPELLRLKELLGDAQTTKSGVENTINGDGTEDEKNIARAELSLLNAAISNLEQQIQNLPPERRRANNTAQIQPQMQKIVEMGCALIYIAR